MIHKLSLFVVFLIILVLLFNQQDTSAQPHKVKPIQGRNSLSTFGYGISLTTEYSRRVPNLGFNWAKVYGPAKTSQPVNILARIEVDAVDRSCLSCFRRRIRRNYANYANYVDAYEIGNEPNLQSEWDRSPNAEDYVDVLCAAADEIRSFDPTAVIVTAGLATTGRIEGSWGRHQSHNGIVQDEREYLRELIDAHGSYCADAIGYHPLGFRADFDAAPDVDGGTPETDCGHGFCFRSVEKFREIMVEKGLGDMPIWGTEAGWITEPPLGCTAHPSWEGRVWQIVTPEKQATNLVGAYEYARQNYPWMEALFIFNYNFNEADYYDSCEQMRFYSVLDNPAEGALHNMFEWAYMPVVHNNN